ncbi:MAG: hypothetical protein B7C54_06285 [Acidimicrobiales bacterium mtb01]|nr:GNAT family N-acetyltransferase [Actinomycetota bacterium]TEX46866.1 MAG: hypothetical protein B7C54_06285 [Acidimicrobiales bacterium mtb01]
MTRPDDMAEIRLVRREQHRHRPRRYRSDVITGLRQRRRDGLPRLLDDGRTRARLRPWPHQSRIAQLILTDHTKAPTVATLLTWLAVARDHGFDSIRTGALSDSATPPFVELGFESIQRLALLRLELDRHNDDLDTELHGSSRAARHELRAVRGSRQIATLARIDRAAFVDGWDLDATGIVDACRATPQHRVRLAVTANDDPAGYMITGRNGAAGFIQRLAVHPDHEGRGVATSLLVDGLTWLHRRRVEDVLVNTNFDNERALDLYRRFGFESLDESLSVLALDRLAVGSSR